MSQVFSTVPLPVVAFDEGGNVVFWNQAAERLTGWRSEDLGGDPWERLGVGKGGATLPNGRTLQWTEGPRGDPWARWFLGADTSDLADQAERYRKLVHVATEALVIHEAGTITDANPALVGLLGYATADDLVGHSVLEFTHPDDRDRVVRHIETQSEEPYEARVVRRDGEQLAVELRAFNVKLDGRGVRVVTVRDVGIDRELAEERMLFENRVQHAQKLESLGLLAGGIAHDFNNLLVGIIGNAGLARRRTYDAQLVRLIEQIEHAASRAAELTQQLLAYSGRGRFLVGPVNINELIQEMTQLVGASITKQATLRMDLADGLPCVDADATQLRQVVMNLVLNASDALESVGVIGIRTEVMEVGTDFDNDLLLEEDLEPGVYVIVEVSDTGRGMESETLQRIFDPFFTTKLEENTIEEGRGLGLAAVLGIVRGHGGAIEVYTQPGEGTTFKVLLPASFEEVPVEQAAPAPLEAELPLEMSGLALVVDDEEAVREVAKLALQDLGLEVLVANDGLEALELYEHYGTQIRVILLDLTMPRLDGVATYKRLMERGLEAPVLFSSGYDRQDALRNWEGPVPAGFLQKPYRIRTLMDHVRKILG